MDTLSLIKRDNLYFSPNTDMNKAVSILLCVNALQKGMDLSLLPSDMDFLALVQQLV